MDFHNKGDLNMKKLNPKNRIENSQAIPFIIMLLLGSLFVIAYLAVTGNNPETFKDIVIEYTALIGSNKSAERNLFYILSIGGCIFYAIYHFLYLSKANSVPTATSNSFENSSLFVYPFVCFFISYSLIYAQNNWLISTAILLMIILFFSKVLTKRTPISSGIIVFFLCTYALCGVFRLYALIYSSKNINTLILSTISIILVLFCLIIDIFIPGIQIFCKISSILQIFIPFTLCIFLFPKYQYNSQFISIPTHPSIAVVIITLILIFCHENFIAIKKNWNSSSPNSKSIITHGTLISIISFNSYIGSGSIINDLHHPFENTIGYFQMFELCQTAFLEYIPVSGMYSVIQGFFLSFFGDGQVSNYYATQNFFYLLLTIFIVILLKKQLPDELLLFISLFIIVLDYNRFALILPITLLLSLPKLVAQKNLWLKVWFLSSFFHGLYYPVFGAATCLGFLPLGLYQINSYVQSGQLKKDISKVSFWSWWLLCLFPVILGVPYLTGTLKHMLAMSSQTIYADGIAKFGQTIPDFFLPYTENLTLRLILYYLFCFILPVSIIWLSVILALQLRKTTHKNKIPSCIALSIGIMLLISFSYTVVRLDMNTIYSRNIGLVIVAFVMFTVIANNYIVNFNTKIFTLCFCTFLLAVSAPIGFFSSTASVGILSLDSNSKLESCYTVPDGYVYTNNNQIEKLGPCFIDETMYDSITQTFEDTRKLDSNKSYLGIVRSFDLYYLCDLKGDSVMVTGTLKGYDAVKETVELMRNNKTIVGNNISPINNYYLYHWLITSGEYVWSDTHCRFEPANNQQKKQEILLHNKNNPLALDGAHLGRIASSWGNSINTLQKIFTKPIIDIELQSQNLSTQINLATPIDGDSADFVYVEFSKTNDTYAYTLFDLQQSHIQNTDDYPLLKHLMKKDYNDGTIVSISWLDDMEIEHSMNALMGKGKLLIPLGCGKEWLLNKHSHINISIMTQDGTKIAVPNIQKIEFLKLREIE